MEDRYDLVVWMHERAQSHASAASHMGVFNEQHLQRVGKAHAYHMAARMTANGDLRSAQQATDTADYLRTLASNMNNCFAHAAENIEMPLGLIGPMHVLYGAIADAFDEIAATITEHDIPLDK